MLLVHPSEKTVAELGKHYMKTSVTCTVQHICHYLGTKLGTSADFQITLSKRGRTFVLPKYLSLSEILKSVRPSSHSSRTLSYHMYHLTPTPPYSSGRPRSTLSYITRRRLLISVIHDPPPLPCNKNNVSS